MLVDSIVSNKKTTKINRQVTHIYAVMMEQSISSTKTNTQNQFQSLPHDGHDEMCPRNLRTGTIICQHDSLPNLPPAGPVLGVHPKFARPVLTRIRHPHQTPSNHRHRNDLCDLAYRCCSCAAPADDARVCGRGARTPTHISAYAHTHTHSSPPNHTVPRTYLTSTHVRQFLAKRAQHEHARAPKRGRFIFILFRRTRILRPLNHPEGHGERERVRSKARRVALEDGIHFGLRGGTLSHKWVTVYCLLNMRMWANKRTHTHVCVRSYTRACIIYRSIQCITGIPVMLHKTLWFVVCDSWFQPQK